MTNLLKNQIIIDGLEYCNWNREVLENLWNGGITAVHVTLVYWENTEESFKKINEIEQLIQNNQDIICKAKNSCKKHVTFAVDVVVPVTPNSSVCLSSNHNVVNSLTHH